jgi:DNA-binding NarL/FixJ family response regulator
VHTAIRSAATGSVFICEAAQTALVDEMTRRATASPADIDEGVRDVLQLIADDLTPNEIAAQLHLAVATVRGRLQDAYKRFGVRGITAAAVEAIRQGHIK